MTPTVSQRKRVVIAGGGFAGLWAARTLSKSTAVDVLVVDCNNYHTFLPLLYQVAAAELEPEQIAYPMRGIFRKMKRVDFRLSTIRGGDKDRKVLFTDGGEIPYDYLIVAMGSNTEFFGVEGAEENCFRMKTLEQAIALRNQILTCFEKAAHEPDPAARDQMLTFTVVGGGPTGVEYAGALAELIRNPIAKDFPFMSTAQARVVLIEAGNTLLPGYPQDLGHYTFHRLSRMGVDVRLNTSVAKVEKNCVHFGNSNPLPTDTVVWSAGIRGSRAAPLLDLPIGRGNRVPVQPTLQLQDYPEIYIVGDLAQPDKADSPMIAPNAVQQGRLAAKNILQHLKGKKPKIFKYKDKGSMATIGRSAAVVRVGKRTVTGIAAWWMWLVIHLAYLIGFRNRIFVLTNWAWDYLFFERAVRLILPRDHAWVRNHAVLHESGVPIENSALKTEEQKDSHESDA